MRVCLLGTYERDYPRNQVLIKGLKSVGVDFFECHIDIWQNVPDKTGILTKPVEFLITFLKLFFAYPILAFRYLTAPKHDVVMFLYPGHLDVILLGWLVKLNKCPIVFDCFISLFDTSVTDRQLAKSNSIAAKLLKLADVISCKLANHVVLDTNAHIEYFINSFGISRQKCSRIFAGVDTELFVSQQKQSFAPMFQVLFVGKFTPLHGIDVIMNAAQHLKENKMIKFVLIGTGQLHKAFKGQSQEQSLSNVEFAGWIPYEKLPNAFQSSDLCLGIFSDSKKADRVIPNKIFQAMSCAKPVLTARTTGCRELFREDENIFYVSPNNSRELADKILDLANDKTRLSQVAFAGQSLICSEAGIRATGLKFKEILEKNNDTAH